MEDNRRNWVKKIALALAGITLAHVRITASPTRERTSKQLTYRENMKVGAFSVSLSVKDINASKQFYESLGFKVFAGDLKKNYLIMKNGVALIGLFQGMFEKNILTFNPGWDEDAKKLQSFDDVREIQRELKNKGIKLVSEVDEKTTGPGSIVLMDPDGNQVLFDQHV